MPLGRIVYVMGPSGAGKDSVLRCARRQLDGERVAFAHRYITRPPTPGDENHVALSPAEFAARCRHGLFAMRWSAHGLDYGIGIEIRTWLEAGLTVVVSGSRGHFSDHCHEMDAVLPVVVSAPAGVIAARLAARGREDKAAVEERLRRGGAFTVDHPALVAIENSGLIEDAGARLAQVIRGAGGG